MVMLKDPSLKYKAFQPIKLPNRQWPNKTFEKPPRWLSTDLRDGNQSLPDPMNFEEKKVYLNKLIEMGFKEIEVAFPSASQVDFDFTRYAVETCPEDISVQVLAPCREPMIRRTVESLKGAKRATVHIYLATSDCFREIVFGLSKEESLALAVDSTKLVRKLTKDDPNMSQTHWNFEFSPETFSDSDPDYVLQVCEAVKEAWGPSEADPIIFNLPATVEMSTPNVYADQIEYFSTHISEREKICISLHPHNDRGCAVAAAELAQLGGADRVEGCLFGNGERTGNVDLVTLALNLYTQGIHPQLDFSDINSIIDIVEKCNKIPVHPRAPYGGQLVVCAFSGSHQDAIKKGFKVHEEKSKTSKNVHWQMPYLPLDPADIGRSYEAIIRVNSQSGKGGASWVILRNMDLDLPRNLQIAFSKIVQNATEVKGTELVNSEIINLFKQEYNVYDEDDEQLTSAVVGTADYELSNPAKNRRLLKGSIMINDQEKALVGEGNGPISAYADALGKALNCKLDVIHYHEHSLGKDSNSKAAAYIECKVVVGDSAEQNIWGIGIHEDVSQATFSSLISVVNSAIRKNIIKI